MDDPNLEIIRHGYDLYDRGDMDGFTAICDPEVEIRPILGAALASDVYRGRDGVRRWREDIFDAMDLRVELLDVEPVGDDRYLTTVRFHGRGRASGANVDLLVGQVLTVRDGVLHRLDGYAEPAQARAALGLGEA
jgi:ketosteroid isomerase-like protein